ncbi:HAMP domain-containing sensor histidine kinase [Roseburia hominis]
MRSTLYLKFVALYVIFGFLSIFAVSALFPLLTTNYLENETGSDLYQEASLLASDYLPGYFSEKITLSEVYAQFGGMRSYLEASVWLVDREGKMLASVRTDELPYVPSSIEDFDPAEGGSEVYSIGNYHGYFTEDMITVMTPVTQKFTTKGYLLIHKPYRHIEENCSVLMWHTFIIMVTIYLFSFVILLGIHFLIYRPLKKVTDAAKQYASGNLDVVIPVNTQDEMGYLSASLNYMSSQLKDMEDYQKKFVANVSHDFRSPLTSIKGYVEAMADGTIPPEMHEKYLRIILFETERLTDLTRDLLTLNEFDTKNLLLDKSNFNIHEMIRNTAASFEGTCTAKKISINLLFSSRNVIVYADKRKIQQVLYNLLDNAIKFSNPESTITVETTERGDKVFTSVKDEGIGIPKTSLNKIWERFYKTDLSRGKDKKGTGLGLSIVKEAIQAHGENINVISTEGVGTEFIFSLPKEKIF